MLLGVEAICPSGKNRGYSKFDHGDRLLVPRDRFLGSG